MKDVAKVFLGALGAFIVYGFLHELFFKHVHKKMGGEKEPDKE